VLKKLTYDYIKERSQTPEIDGVSTETLNQLLVWLASNYNDIRSSNLTDIIELQRANFAIDKKHRNQLLKRFNGGDIRNGNFFRDIALFLEHYNMIEESLFFMSKAKMYSPTLKPTDEKLKEYKATLKVANTPPLSLINTIRRQIKRTLLLIRSVWS
jgi:hypothetical protein